jgi:Holliday junction resolvase RusA-like endonuclease
MAKSFVIPLPPYPSHRHSNKRATARNKQLFYDLVRECAKDVVSAPNDRRLSLSLDFYGKREDLDNLLKLLLDAFTGVLYKDDRQVVELTARVFRSSAKPRVEVAPEFFDDDKEAQRRAVESTESAHRANGQGPGQKMTEQELFALVTTLEAAGVTPDSLGDMLAKKGG